MKSDSVTVRYDSRIWKSERHRRTITRIPRALRGPFPLPFSVSHLSAPSVFVGLCLCVMWSGQVTATSLPWHPLLSPSSHCLSSQRRAISTRRVLTIQAFRRSDFDRFGKRVVSGEAWKEAWRSANDGFELLLFDAKKAAERFDRRYSVSRRLSSVVQSATDKAREIDRELEIERRWRTFTLDFSRNWPRYRRQLNDFLDTPLGRTFSTIFFLWFALSGWLFQFMIFATLVLPFAAPLLIGTVANNFVIQGSCPACKQQFMGYKNQVVRCVSCGNIVWQPKDNFSSGGGGRDTKSSSSGPDIIDVDFEEK